jgi:hypothetical protein
MKFSQLTTNKKLFKSWSQEPEHSTTGLSNTPTVQTEEPAKRWFRGSNPQPNST